jgi:hypothetical protein
VDQSIKRNALVLGTQHYSRGQLERLLVDGERVQIRVLGLASIASDVPVELALATIESVEVLGAFRASPPVKKALASRTI